MFCLEAWSDAFNLHQLSHHLCEMFENFNVCLSKGPHVYSLEWNQGLATQFSQALSNLFSLPLEKKIRLFWRLTNTSSFCSPSVPPEVLSKVYLDLAESELQIAIHHQEEGEISKARNVLRSSQHLFQMGKKFSFSVEEEDELFVEELVEEMNGRIASLELLLLVAEREKKKPKPYRVVSGGEEREKKIVLEKLKGALEELERVEKEENIYDFLHYLFEKYPPKMKQWKKPKQINRETGKKVFRWACVWYHPDKNQKWGMEWEVLCEEISKIVSKKYSIFKE